MIRKLSKIRRLVTAFEAGSLRPNEWHHRTRLALGLWYVLNPAHDGALEAMRRGIVACHARLRGSVPTCRGFHETITAFYLGKIEAFAVSAPPGFGLIELANALLASELANPRLHLGLPEADGSRSGMLLPVCGDRTFPDMHPAALAASPHVAEPMNFCAPDKTARQTDSDMLWRACHCRRFNPAATSEWWLKP